MNNNMPVINISKNIKDNPLEVWVKIKNYPKYADASRELNIDKSKIAKVARNSMSIDSRGFVYNNFSAGGYKWKYI